MLKDIICWFCLVFFLVIKLESCYSLEYGMFFIYVIVGIVILFSFFIFLYRYYEVRRKFDMNVILF